MCVCVCVCVWGGGECVWGVYECVCVCVCVCVWGGGVLAKSFCSLFYLYLFYIIAMY